MNKKIIKDGFLLLIAKLVSIGCGTVVAIFVARYFGVEIYGQYTTAIAFASFILTFTDFGTDTYLLKEASRNKKLLQEYYGNIILIKLAVLLLSIFLILILVNLLGYSADVKKITLVILPNLICAFLTGTFFVIMQTENKLQVNAKIQILQSLLTVISVGITVLLKINIFVYSALQSLIAISILVAYLCIVPVKFKPTFIHTKKIVSGSIVFGLSSLLFIVYYKLDTVMLSVIKGTYEVGIYESAYKIVSILIGCIGILDNLIMPKFFMLYKTNIGKMIDIYEELARKAIIFGVAASVIFMYISKYIINILYGSQYNDSILILQILMWTVVIRLMAAISGFVITASDNMRTKVKFQLVFAIINIIINIILIPKFGVIGASISSVITEFLVFITYYLFVYNNFRGKIDLFTIIKCILMNCLLIILLSFFQNVNFILMCLICILSYGVVEVIFFRKDVFKLVKIGLKKQ